MTPKRWVALGALASMPFGITAQPAPARPDPLDANAAVAPPSYQSAFDNYQRATIDAQLSADKVWRKANDEVAEAGTQAGDATPDAVAPPPPAKPAPVASEHH